MTQPPSDGLARSDDWPPPGDGAQSDGWTTRLAQFLHRDPTDRNALAALSDALATGDRASDQTRHTILRLLAQRSAQIAPRPTLSGASPLPDWPAHPAQPVPPFHPAGLAGTSLIAVCHDDGETVAAALPFWLATAVDEILLIDWSPTAQLPTPQLDAMNLSDPRLRIIRLDGADLSPAQAFNVGFRLCRHQRILALAPAVRLAADYLATPVTAHEFRVDPGPADGSGFVLDLDRRDLAQAGGFNEYLDSADWCLADLTARLAALGLRAAPITGHFTRPPPAPPVQLGQDSLRHTLLHSRDFAALRNRFIAAIMPDWSAPHSRAFGLAAATGPGLVLRPLNLRPLILRPLSPPALKPPLLVRAEAENHALCDLTARHIGGAPVMLGTRRLDIVLNRPAHDVCAIDIAVAGGPHPQIVKSRRAWLVVDIAPDCLPLYDTPAQTAFRKLQDLATQAQMTLVLRLPADTQPDEAALLSDHPHIPPQPDLTQTDLAQPDLARGFYPLTLRDLQASPDWLPTHSTFAFNARTVADFARLANSGPGILLRRPKLFIDAQHGLGNRLRAMASAGAIAAATGRELVIIWQPDAHCACRFEDLFLPTGAVLDQGFHRDAPAMDIDLFNYMQVEPGSTKEQPVSLGAFRDAYLRSAYPLVSPCSNWHSENTWLHSLRPVPVVLDLVASVRNPNDLSVHIRMEGGAAAQHLPYESAANWTPAAHREIDHWRKRSHFSFFLTRLDQLVAQGQADRIFLAADTPAVYDALLARYGDRIACLPRRVTDRSTQAMVYALADALLLSRAPRLLGSTWSSFSELAARLATAPYEVELSGRDF